MMYVFTFNPQAVEFVNISCHHHRHHSTNKIPPFLRKSNNKFLYLGQIPWETVTHFIFSYKIRAEHILPNSHTLTQSTACHTNTTRILQIFKQTAAATATARKSNNMETAIKDTQKVQQEEEELAKKKTPSIFQSPRVFKRTFFQFHRNAMDFCTNLK